MKAYVFFVFLIPACTNALSNCAFKPGCPLPNNANDIMTTEQEIQEKCNDFAKYSKCIDDWGKDCLGAGFSNVRQTYYNNVLPLTKLCSDNAYKREYLQESESLSKVKDNWNKCVKDVEDYTKNIATSFTSVEDKVKQIKSMCCGVKNFDSCTKDLCKDCSPKALEIYNGLSSQNSLLSSSQCKEILDDCPGGSSTRNTLNIICLAISMMVYVLVR